MLNSIRWWRHKSSGYAVTKIDSKFVALHQMILPPIHGVETDHINRDRLDNRVENLRYVTKGQNRFNSGGLRNNTSGHKGVFYFKRIDRWGARRGNPGKYLGCFKTKAQAIRAYRDAVREKHRELFGSVGSEG